jgi:hypothetical protein
MSAERTLSTSVSCCLLGYVNRIWQPTLILSGSKNWGALGCCPLCPLDTEVLKNISRTLAIKWVSWALLPGIEIYLPITVASRSKVWTVFACSNTGVVRSNPTQSMNVCVRLFCISVVLYTGRDLAKGCSPIQGVLPTVYKIKKMKKGQGPTKEL